MRTYIPARRRFFLKAYWLEPLLAQTRKNAVKRGIEFDLSLDDLKILSLRADGRCEVTGIVFEAQHRDNDARHFRRPFYPSIDRVDSRVGYKLSNCRLTCVAVNAAINEWGESVLFRIAHAIVTPESERLPKGIRVRRDGPRNRYCPRFRSAGMPDVHLGTFSDPQQAIEALETYSKNAPQLPQDQDENN